MFLLVPAYLGSPGQNAVKRSYVLTTTATNFIVNQLITTSL